MSRYTCKHCGSDEIVIRREVFVYHPVAAHQPDTDECGRVMEGCITFHGTESDDEAPQESTLYCRECYSELNQDEVDLSEGKRVGEYRTGLVVTCSD